MKRTLSASIIAAATALGFAAGNLTASAPEPAAVVDVQTEQLLEHATTECVALIRAHSEQPQCRIGEVQTPKGEIKQGWLCNGGYMGSAQQACLDAALEAMPE